MTVEPCAVDDLPASPTDALAGEAVARIDRAMAPVGATVSGIRDLLGSLIDDGDVFLVGSLAAGLGNRGSDIDLQIFVEHDRTNGVPMMFFLGTTMIDVQYFSRQTPSAVIDGLSRSAVRVSSGWCALGAAPRRSTAKALSRWATAQSFDDAVAPLVAADTTDAVNAVLVRAAVEDAFRLGGTAQLIDAVGRPATFAWRRAGRAAAEVAARAAGDIFIGDKWTWSKVARAGVAPDLVERCARVSTLEDWYRVAADVGLPTIEPASVLELAVQHEATVKVGDSRHILVDRRRLVAEPTDPGPNATRVERLIASFDLVAEGASNLRVEADLLDRLLGDAEAGS